MAVQSSEMSRKLTYQFTDFERFGEKTASLSMNNVDKGATNEQLMQVADALKILVGGNMQNLRITITNDIGHDAGIEVAE